jgi:hypothetical protein
MSCFKLEKLNDSKVWVSLEHTIVYTDLALFWAFFGWIVKLQVVNNKECRHDCSGEGWTNCREGNT